MKSTSIILASLLLQLVRAQRALSPDSSCCVNTCDGSKSSKSAKSSSWNMQKSSKASKSSKYDGKRHLQASQDCYDCSACEDNYDVCDGPYAPYYLQCYPNGGGFPQPGSDYPVYIGYIYFVPYSGGGYGG